MGPNPTDLPEESFNKEVLPAYELYMSDRGSEWKAKSAA